MAQLPAYTLPTWMVPLYVFLLDVIPDYIQKTFGVDEQGHFLGGKPLRTLREGERIPEDVRVAIIVYNNAQWQIEQAYTLEAQIKDSNPGAVVVGIPVQG